MKNIINSKNIKIVLLILVVVLLALLFIFTLNKKHIGNKKWSSSKSIEDVTPEDLDEESVIEDEGEIIFLIPQEEIYSFYFTDNNGILLKFERKDDQWVYTDDESLDINEDRIDKVLNYFTDIRFTDVIAGENAEDYGITKDSPQYYVYDAAGYATIISIGDTDADTGNVYFALNNDFSVIYVNSGKLKNVSQYGIEDLIALN